MFSFTQPILKVGCVFLKMKSKMKKEKEKIETRGGRREGAGAPRKKVKKVQIFFGVLPHLKNDINFKNYIKQKINEYEV